MKSHVVIAIVAVCCLTHDEARSRASAFQPQVSKAFATVDLVPGKPFVVVHLKNLSNVAAEERAFVLGQRERQAKILRLWIDALQTVSGKTPQQAKTTLGNVLGSDPRFMADPTDSWALTLRLHIGELIASPDATSAFSNRVAALKQQFTLQREQALRHTVR